MIEGQASSLGAPARGAQPGRRSKLVDLAAAAALIPDGANLALGGIALHIQPMALIRELIRQGRKDLTVIGDILGLNADILAGAGALRRVEASGVGLERYGLARNFRRAVETGQVVMADFSDSTSLDRIVAARENLTFYPVTYLGGTDIPKYLPELVPFKCPITGQDLYAMPPAQIDFAVIHMPYADEYGNALVPTRAMMPDAIAVMMARAAKSVIITVEQVVPNSLVRQNPYLNQIPSYRTTAVAEAAWGAHPASMPDFYDVDDNHLQEYVASSASSEAFGEYLRKYVHGVPDHVAYLEAVGIRSLLQCRKVRVI